MGTTQDDVDTRDLWKEARQIFSEAYPKADDSYLQATSTPKDLVHNLRNRKGHSIAKHKKCGAVIEKLELIANIADIAMKATPETVSLVWTGFRFAFDVFLSGVKDREMIVSAIDHFAEMVLVCETYGVRHFRSQNLSLGVRDATLQLIPEVLATVIEFSYLVQQYFRPRHFTAVVNFFTGRGSELRGVIDDSKLKCDRLHTLDNAAFKDEMRKALRQRSKDSDGIERMINHVANSLGSGLKRLREDIQDIKEQWDEDRVLRDFEGNLSWLRDSYKLDMNLSTSRHEDNLKWRDEGSCQWIFQDEVPEYQAWIGSSADHISTTGAKKATTPHILWIYGNSGVGKSFLVSSIIQEVQKQRQHVLVYFFCKLGDQQRSQDCATVMLDLCAQLFREVRERDLGSLDLRQEFNSITDGFRADPLRTEIDRIRDFFLELTNALEMDVVVAVDALDECVAASSKRGDASSKRGDALRKRGDAVNDVDALEKPVDYDAPNSVAAQLKILSNSNSKVHVLISSRTTGPGGVPSILIDESRTEADIRNYVKRRFGNGPDTDEIVRKSKGMFRYAMMVVEGHKESGGAVRRLSRRLQDLPDGMDALYRLRFDSLNGAQKDILVTVLRWLICRGDRIQLLPIADELAPRYGPNENSSSECPSLKDVAREITKVGRDFVKVTDDTVQLEHNSVRDFVLDSSKEGRAAGNICPACGQSPSIDAIFRAAGKEGSLTMAEYMLQTINSAKFQEDFILFEYETGNRKLKGRKGRSGTKKALRYEASAWYKHLRDAEAAWTSSERNTDPRWPALYDQADNFLSGNRNVYEDWVRRKFPEDETAINEPRLHAASRFGLEGLIKRYIDEGDDVNVKTEHKSTALHRICYNGRSFAGLTLLLESGADFNARNAEKRTALSWVCQKLVEGTKPITDLLERGADPDIADKWRKTCLHYAVLSHNIDACRELLPESSPEQSKSGISKSRTNKKDHHGETPLHWACKSNAPQELVALLIDRGADWNAKDKEDQTPLYEACKVGNERVVRHLLDRGVDLDDKDMNGDTALHAAVYSSNLELVKILVLEGSKIDVRNKSSQTPLTLAASRKQWEIMLCLLQSYKEGNGNMNILLQPDRHGDTPLALAVEEKNLAAVQKLLDGSSVEETVAQKMCQTINSNGNQPLHKAAFRGCPRICQLLIQHGAPIDSPGNTTAYGPTPLDAAFRGWQELSEDSSSKLNDFEDTIRHLLSKSGKITGRQRKFICAIWRGSTQVCGSKQFKTMRDSRDEHGWLPAVVAAYFGHERLARMIGAEGENTYIEPLPSKKVLGERHGYMPSSWSDKKKHDSVTLSKKKMVASFSSSKGDSFKEAAVFANHPVPAGMRKFYFEVTIGTTDKEIDGSVKVAVGFCTDLAYCNSMPGSRSAKAPSWGYHGDKGRILTRFDNGRPYEDNSGAAADRGFGVGDVIGCGIDFTSGLGHAKIFYTKNGHHLGVAFEGVSGRLFPVVGTRSVNVKMEVNFGQNDEKRFLWKGEKTE